MIFVKNLNFNYYFLLRNCDYILGNSSSGIVEAATFSKPVINLGIRQSGKLMPKNIISCKFNTNSILKAIRKIKNKNFKKKLYNIKNPYGDGKSGKRIGKFLKNLEIKKIYFQKNLLPSENFKKNIRFNRVKI